MRLFRYCLLAAASTALCTLPAYAQTKATPKAAAPAGIETRYFEIEAMIDGLASIIIKETRQGQKLTAATLDACYSAERGTERKDRFVVDLKINGNELTGTTQSQIDKMPVAVNVTRRGTGGTYEFKGKIQVGNTVNEILSVDNADIGEREFLQTVKLDNIVTEQPQDFTEVSPEAVAVKVKLDALNSFVTSLRGQPIEVTMDSLVTSCEALRSGEQTVTIAVDPLRAPDFVNKVKSIPGVVSAGWTTGAVEMDRTMLFKAEGWRDAAALNREAIVTAVSETLGGRLKAKLTTTDWDPETAKLRLVFKRPSPTLPAQNLTETIEYTLLVAPEKRGSTENLMMWISTPTSVTNDEGTGPKLILSDAHGPEGYSDPLDDRGEVAALRSRFGALRWNSETGAWDK